MLDLVTCPRCNGTGDGGCGSASSCDEGYYCGLCQGKKVVTPEEANAELVGKLP
jgi:hypothetical protein